jgi:hypothetical protein
MTRSVAVCVVLLLLAAPAGATQPVSFINYPPGYAAGIVPLGPGNFAVALAADPQNENFLYAAGNFSGVNRIVHLDLRSGARTSVFTCPTTVTVAGFAVLDAHAIFISDNMHDRLYVLRDNNPRDGDFDDPGEARELITPILTNPGGDWTGSAVAIVRSASNRLHLPAGTVLFQSEDGGTTHGEVLAVVNPLTHPAYQPPANAFVSGFNYGGGLAFDSAGRLLVASSFYPSSGKVWICDDLNGNAFIGPGEANILVPRASATTQSVGLSALAVDAINRGYLAVGWGFGTTARSNIESFVVPADPLRGTARVATFASVNSPYVSALVLNSTTRLFAPWASNGATMVILASDPMYGNLDYLLTLKPLALAAVRRWRMY